MNFFDSVKTCLIKKYCNFKGHASRSEFWWFQLVCWVIFPALFHILISANLINLNDDDYNLISIIYILVLFLPFFGVLVRRLHDINLSKWWELAEIIIFIIAIVFLCVNNLQEVTRSNDVDIFRWWNIMWDLALIIASYGIFELFQLIIQKLTKEGSESYNNSSSEPLESQDNISQNRIIIKMSAEKHNEMHSGNENLNDQYLSNKIKVGNIVNFGKYFINNNQTKESIEWLVLEVSDNKALLITKDAIDYKPYNEENVDVTWEECTLRNWLNNEFINQAFSKKEQKKIALTKLPDSDNIEDKIFLLSIDEVKNYFNNKEDRKCKVTNYICAKRSLIIAFCTFLIKGTFWWWLRSPGILHMSATTVCSNGRIWSIGGITYGINYVRPALWINLQ